MSLMDRISIRDWSQMTYDEKYNHISSLQSLRDFCRKESTNQPTKSARANKEKLESQGKKSSIKKPNTSNIKKLLAGLTPEQLLKLKKGFI